MRTRSSKDFSKDTAPKKADEEKVTSTVESDISGDAPVVEEEVVSAEKMINLEDVERAKQLLTEGKRHFICGDAAEASQALSEVCSIFASYYGDISTECAEAYYYYGRTLLDLARKEPGVVANAVDGWRSVEGDQEGETSGADQVENPEALDKQTSETIREEVLDALDENSTSLEEQAKKAKGELDTAAGGDKAAADVTTTTKETGETTSSKEGSDTHAGTAPKETGDGGSTSRSQKDTPAVEEIGDDEADEIKQNTEDKENDEPVIEEELPEEVSNLQLAWEMLDLARVIYEKGTDKASRERVADTRLALGEQAMEDEELEKAVTEFETCIEIQKEVMDKDDRRVATAFYNLAVTYTLGQKYEEAADSFKQALAVLELRRNNLQTKFTAFGANANATEKTELEEEINDLTAIIADVQGRIQDCIDSRVQTDASKKALDELKASDNKAENGHGETKAAGDGATSDISHLVRKTVKRDADDEIPTAESIKKAKVDAAEEAKGENGHVAKNGNGTAEVVTCDSE